jgi:hypothetical protein
MREFITYPTTPTFANPTCRSELHPPDKDEWEREVQPVIDWILAGCHLAPFPHPLLTLLPKIKPSAPPIYKTTTRKAKTLVQP